MTDPHLPHSPPSPRPRPTPEQIVATDPHASAWVGANAGSGKTHVLTQRVARLMLAGAEPQKILCLTYTKAAAAEMQTRLFALLGEWAMMPPSALAERLGALSGGQPVTDPARLATARRLFARALETPGGLKIQTIHAFCESLLRRFPLEAQVSPRFNVADDRQAQALVAAARLAMAEAAATGRNDGFDRAAIRLNEGGLDALCDGILSDRGVFALASRAGNGRVEPMLRAHLGALAEADEVAIAHDALASLDMPAMRTLSAVLETHGGASAEKPFAALLRAWLAAQDHGTAADPALHAKALMGSILTKDHNPRKTGFPTKAVISALPGAAIQIQNLTEWALETRDRIMAVRIAARTRDLYAFGQPLLGQYSAAKSQTGLLDFDDLITRAAALLTQADLRAWVLYKLDLGIDHILVDEAQDTAPAQWQVIAAIAEEFFAGQTARPDVRSLFVVGDEKQSIYSFQGAEPQAFGQMRQGFADRLLALGTPLGRPDLRTSFRSAPAILDFVDAVFDGDAARGLTVDGAAVVHRAHRAQDQGRVDLWPLVPKAEAAEGHAWHEPVDLPPPGDAKDRLAEILSTQIAGMIGGTHLPARGGVPGRAVAAGDILVLVSKRDRLAQGIIRGLKAHGVPVAGADRMHLTAEIAVQDLLALARVATTPGDDLALAALLRSPLCGLSDDDLFALAYARPAGLGEALAASPHTEAAAMIDDMAGRADFLRPYEFFERALTGHEGRQRLLARLGDEAEDAIDELLAQALTYEADQAPSLAGFVAWLESGDHIVKREMDQSAGQVRVMTVHGAKGLEAPVVILPDLVSQPRGSAGRPVLLRAEGGANAPDLMLWAGAKTEDDAVAARARAAAAARDAAERKRLFYVALTRAEDWLILCGAEPGRMPPATWYSMAEAAIAQCGAVALETPAGSGSRFQTGPEPSGAAPAGARPDPAPTPPSPLGPVGSEPRRTRRVPSDLVPHHPTGGAGLGREVALDKGRAVHDLLDKLAGDRAGFADRAARFLEQAYPALPPHLCDAAVAEADAVLSAPACADLFGPGALSEVPVAIDDASGRPRMIGRIDRLVADGKRVLIADIKTDADVPETPEAVPRAYLAQLGAYASAMATAYPAHRIALALIWTATATRQEIPTQAALQAFRSTSAGA